MVHGLVGESLLDELDICPLGGRGSPAGKGTGAGGSRKRRARGSTGLEESRDVESEPAGAPPGDTALLDTSVLHASSPGESVLGRSPELWKAPQA